MIRLISDRRLINLSNLTLSGVKKGERSGLLRNLEGVVNVGVSKKSRFLWRSSDSVLVFSIHPTRILSCFPIK